MKPAVYARMMKLPHGTEGWQRKKLCTVHLSFPRLHQSVVVWEGHRQVSPKGGCEATSF